MLPNVKNSYRMSTYLNHNQKLALKLCHYRNPNFASDVATNQIPTGQSLFDSDWWMLNSSRGYYKREEVHLVVTNILNKLSKNTPPRIIFEYIIMVLGGIESFIRKQSFVYLSFVFSVQNFFSWQHWMVLLYGAADLNQLDIEEFDA